MTNTALTALFLQQSILDSEADYHRSLSTATFPTWDAVVITASNDSQAEAYEQQIKERLSRLPSRTDFLVIPDEGNKRVGCGDRVLITVLTASTASGIRSEKHLPLS